MTADEAVFDIIIFKFEIINSILLILTIDFKLHPEVSLVEPC